jgi:hypothetical protein
MTHDIVLQVFDRDKFGIIYFYCHLTYYLSTSSSGENYIPGEGNFSRSYHGFSLIPAQVILITAYFSNLSLYSFNFTKTVILY